MNLLVILTLAGKRLPLQQWMTKCKPKIGMTGLSSALTLDATLTSLTLINPSNSTSLLPLLQG
jgi:hypothetical protein